MNKFEIRIGIETDIATLQPDLLDAITKTIKEIHPEVIQRSVNVVELPSETDNDDLKLQIENLTGRSKIIASYLYNSPGGHSTQELREIIDSQQPFKNHPILHSYLNNLISRGLVTKVSTGVYRSARWS